MNHHYETGNTQITLLPMSEHDSELYRRLRNQECNRKCFIFSGIIEKEAQALWYKNYLQKENDYMFSIYNKTGQFLGGAALYDITNHSAEFGRIIIDRNLAGRGGIGYEVLILLCQFAKTTLGLSTLHLEVFDENLSARKTYEKAGFYYKTQSEHAKSGKILHYMEKQL